MKNYIKDYINKIEKKDKLNKDEIEELLIKIRFFSHERLIHLIVMLFTGLFTILFVFLSYYNYYFIIVCFISLILFLFYIIHYFFLENSIQLLYKLYDKFK